MDRPRPQHFRGRGGNPNRSRGSSSYRGHRSHPYAPRPPRPNALPPKRQPPTPQAPPVSQATVQRTKNTVELNLHKKKAFRNTLRTCIEAAKLLAKQKNEPDFGKNYPALQSKLDELIYAQGEQTGMTIQQEIDLIRVVIDFYKENGIDSSTRYDCFYTLFLAREGQTPRLHDRRVHVLTRLCSMALQLKIFAVFDDLATYWLKVGSDSSIPSVIDRLIEDYIRPPPAYSSFLALLPLRSRALEFSCFFLAFGISSEVCGPQIATVVGQWLTEDLTDVLEFYGENPELARRFGDTTLPLLVQWDIEQDSSSEEADRFHCAITGLIVYWYQKAHPITLDVFVEIVSNAESLQPRQISRLLDNATSAISRGMFPTERFVNTFTNTDSPKVLRESPFVELIEKSFENKFHF